MAFKITTSGAVLSLCNALPVVTQRCTCGYQRCGHRLPNSIHFPILNYKYPMARFLLAYGQTNNMKPGYFRKCCLLLAVVYHVTAVAQSVNPGPMQTVVPGPQYQRSGLHQALWGRHYRKVWTTAQQFPLFFLDTAAGGLVPYQTGGANQSKTLRLRNAQGKEYVLRSIDKNFNRALPDIYKNTFVQRILNDQVSVAHPYAAITIPGMASAAGIYHTRPMIVYVPRQAALDSFNDTYANQLFLFEQRPDENWEEAGNFGNAKRIISTANLLEKLQESGDHAVDHELYIRSRLFDMMIGDWGRHEDQWRWGVFREENGTRYKPIPRDRDQTYTKFDGILLNIALSGAGLGHLESFRGRIDDIGSYNYPARYLDRRITNEATLGQWTAQAKALQQSVTDAAIAQSVGALPDTIFTLTGPQIIAAIKQRRDDLVKYAEAYYRFLSEAVDIPGTDEREWFDVQHTGGGTTTVQLYAIKNSMRAQAPFYSRTFTSSETKEVRLFGISGKDVFTVSGSGNVRVRIIGGPDQDSIAVDQENKKGTFIYDNHNNTISGAANAKMRLSEDTAVHSYRYNAFQYDDKGFKPQLFYNYEDRLFVGFGYEITKQKWRRQPFAYEHGMYARYSLIQGGVSVTYKGTVHQFAKNWNLHLYGNFDVIRWTNFFGTGNETKETTEDRDFFRMRSREIYGSIAVSRQLGRNAILLAGPFYQNMKIINDTDRYVAKFIRAHELFDSRQYAGGILSVQFSKVDDRVFPAKGVDLIASATHTRNLEESVRSFQRFRLATGIYLPLHKRWVAAFRGAAATVTGDADFFQLSSIGGSNSLRGFRRDRFWGKTSFFNSNELQYRFNIRSRLFNGKAAFFGLYDIGRVWQPLEISETLHRAYGAGFSFAPFNRVMFSLAYAISRENGILHLRVGKGL